MRADFGVESLADVWDEAQPLLREDQAEVGFLSVEDLVPQFTAYVSMNQAGILRVYTLRVDGVLQGYNVFLIGPHPHYGGMPWANQDALYVRPAYRGRTALRFMLWCDSQLEDEGVHVVCRQSTPKVPLGRMLERMGYRAHDVNYIRRLQGVSASGSVLSGGHNGRGGCGGGSHLRDCRDCTGGRAIPGGEGAGEAGASQAGERDSCG